MSTLKHHDEISPGETPNRGFTEGVVAWVLALGIGFLFGVLNVGIGVGWLCLVMGLAIVAMGLFSDKRIEATISGVVAIGVFTLFAWGGLHTPNISGSISLILGLIGTLCLGWLLFISLTGRILANEGPFNMMTMVLALVGSALLPFTLAGMQAFHANAYNLGLF